MVFRNRRLFTLLLIGLSLTVSAGLRAAGPSEIAEIEAEQLYRRANDYASNISENGYSYAYIQFYWKRAQANLDRITRVYPDTKIGWKLRRNEVKVGPFELAYFKDRVLPRLEEKKLGAFDDVNCCIFLYNLDEQRWDDNRLAALASILELLCRRQRWNEALAFPVREQDRSLLTTTIFRVAARYKQEKLVAQLLETARPADLELLWPILGEALALNGTPREEIDQLLNEHPLPEVKTAILSGMIDREIGIQRAATQQIKPKNGLQKIHYSLLDLNVRDDVDSVARTFFPSPTPSSTVLLAKYHAAQGNKPAADAEGEVHAAYLEALAQQEKFEEIAKYADNSRLSAEAQRICRLKQIELLAEDGRVDQAEAIRAHVIRENQALTDAAALAEFQGRMDSRELPLTVRDRTFADLPVQDPCVMVEAITNWSLTPNRSLRGPGPWDPIVQRFLPGFADLPLPKSKAVQDAASSSKPF